MIAGVNIVAPAARAEDSMNCRRLIFFVISFSTQYVAVRGGDLLLFAFFFTAGRPFI